MEQTRMLLTDRKEWKDYRIIIDHVTSIDSPAVYKLATYW